MVESIRELRKICQNRDQRYDHMYERFYRKISIYITKAVLYTNISANQVTLLDICIGFVACTMMMKCYYIESIILFFLWELMDRVDGEVAHYRKTASITGEYFDRLNHILVEPFIFISFTLSLIKNIDNVLLILFGFSATTSYNYIKLVMYSLNYGVLERYLNSNGDIRIGYKQYNDIGVEGIKSSFEGIIKILYKSLSFITFPPGLIIMMFISTLLDMLISQFIIINFLINYKFLCLVFYGITLPLISLFLSYNIIKNKEPEKLYEKIFG